MLSTCGPGGVTLDAAGSVLAGVGGAVAGTVSSGVDCVACGDGIIPAHADNPNIKPVNKKIAACRKLIPSPCPPGSQITSRLGLMFPLAQGLHPAGAL